MRRHPESIGPATPEEALRRVLRRLREEQGLTQEKLGFEAGLHRTAVGLIERGQRIPSVTTLYKLAGPLGVTPSGMLTQAEEVLRRARAESPRRTGKKR